MKVTYRTWKKFLKLMPTLAVDGILIENRQVLLVQRAHEPFIGKWITPGGFVEYDERVAQAAEREFEEETGLKTKAVQMLGIYDDPKRDPRGSVITVAYILKRKSGKMKASSESKDVRFFPVNNLPKDRCPDVERMIKDALKVLRKSKDNK